MSYQLKAPIKLQTDYDPQSDLEKIMLQQIDEIERQEYPEDANQGADAKEAANPSEQKVSGASDQISSVVPGESAQQIPPSSMMPGENAQNSKPEITFQLI